MRSPCAADWHKGILPPPCFWRQKGELWLATLGHVNPIQHLNLLLRSDRALNLRSSIMAASRPGGMVLDAGCGSGLLSFWALDAGASSVVAVDMSGVELTRALAAANGFSDRIRAIEGDLWQLDIPDSRNGFSVILAMIYLNDPRRDEAQTRLAYSLRDRFLAPGGAMLPDRVRYTVRACDWPAQDYFSRRAAIRDRIDDLEGRYGYDFGPLSKAVADGCWKEQFPVKQPDGRLARTGAKLLSVATPFVDIDYMSDLVPYPDELEINITSPGVFNTLIWTQELWYKESLLFTNESVSWIEDATAVTAVDTCKVGLDTQWRNSNVARITGFRRG